MMASFTTDTFFNGQIKVMQNRAGYRFSIDAVLLAYHAGPRSGDKVVDLGAGCGIISLIMAFRRPDVRIYAVELQPQLAELAAANVKQNRLADRIDVLCVDMKLLNLKMTAGPLDLIVCNPPYRKPGSGRVNPNSQRAVARHEIKTNLGDVLQTAHRMLRTGGRLAAIFPAERTTDILSQMRNERIEPKLIRMVHSNPDAEARLMLVEGVKGGRPGLKVAPALFIYDQNGDYTDEVQPMFAP
jgi:tRNA1Val (adenine37-N6)-methyltransferase